MTESYNDGLQSPTMALIHARLKRLVVPGVVIFALAGMAGCFAYFVVAPAPVSQSAAIAAPSATETWSSTVAAASMQVQHQPIPVEPGRDDGVVFLAVVVAADLAVGG
jgi:hypothetical protein